MKNNEDRRKDFYIWLVATDKHGLLRGQTNGYCYWFKRMWYKVLLLTVKRGVKI